MPKCQQMAAEEEKLVMQHPSLPADLVGTRNRARSRSDSLSKATCCIDQPFCRSLPHPPIFARKMPQLKPLPGRSSRNFLIDQCDFCDHLRQLPTPASAVMSRQRTNSRKRIDKLSRSPRLYRDRIGPGDFQSGSTRVTNVRFSLANMAALFAISLVVGCTPGNSAPPAATQNSQGA